MHFKPVLFLLFFSQLAFAESTPIFVEERSTVATSADDTALVAVNVVENEDAGRASNSIHEMLAELERLQQQVRLLQGVIEEQNYKIEQMKQHQKDQYVDLDRRIGELNGKLENITSLPQASGGDQEPAGIKTPGEQKQSPGLTDKQLYNKGKEFVLAKKFAESIEAFNSLLSVYPGSEYVPYSHYWLGEVYLAMNPRQIDKAQEHFDIVKKDYSQHPKFPAALYKLGVLYHLKKDNAEARLYLQRVKSQFPDSTEAKKADQYLKKIK